MASQIYQTEGIILRKHNYGEADSLYRLYTEKFGMIMALAKGIRLEKSKLRNHLELFSVGKFAIISIGDFWRIVDVEKKISILADSQGVKLFSEVATLVLRMIQGEEKDEDIWRELTNFFYEIVNKKDVLKKREAQIMATAAIMRILGYAESVPTSANEAVSVVNKAISESML